MSTRCWVTVAVVIAMVIAAGVILTLLGLDDSRNCRLRTDC